MVPLRVAYILQYFPRLTETFVADEIRSIRARGVDVQIISLLKPRSELVSPASRELLPYTWYAPGLLSLRLWLDQLRFLRRSPKLYWRLLITLLSQAHRGNRLTLFMKRLVTFLKAVATASHLSRANVDLLHAHFAWLPAAAAWVCGRLLGKPFTVTVHAYDLYSEQNDLMPLIAREASHLIAISEFNKVHLSSLAAAGATDISLIHCGVELGRSAELPHAPLTAQPDAPLRILSVGSLTEKKGHRYLISACQILQEQGMDFTCAIIGGGALQDALHRQVEACQLTNRVQFLGARTHPEVLACYRDYDLFVLPSIVTADGDRDGIPVVLIEAASAGLPLISTPVSGIPEIVVHQETGLLVPPSEPRALAEAIRILALDPALRARLGRNARALVEERFDIRSTSAQLESLFREIRGERAQHARVA